MSSQTRPSRTVEAAPMNLKQEKQRENDILLKAKLTTQEKN
jgi:hypothetical protein